MLSGSPIASDFKPHKGMLSYDPAQFQYIGYQPQQKDYDIELNNFLLKNSGMLV
jgi:hypothetical protein